MSSFDSFRRVRFALRDGEIAGIAWGDASRPPDILFLHATGFNARTYRTLLEPLADRFHVLAVDLRGHGLSTLPAPIFGYRSWNRHRDDVIALIEAIDAPVTLAGHSMGATVSLLAGGKRPDLVRGLCLLDPVIMPPMTYATAGLPGMALVNERAFQIAAIAKRRRATFDSRGAFVSALSGRGIFKSFSAETLEDYAEDGLVSDGEGRFTLACKPAFEARTFAATAHDPWGALERAPTPLVVLRAQTGSTFRDACVPRLQAVRSDARVATLEGTTHALPMERPDRVRSSIETVCVRTGGKTGQFRDLV